MDMFGRVPMLYGGAFTADAALVTFGGPGIVGGGVGLLTQEISFTYRQNVTRVYEVGSRYTFFVAGRAQGEGNMRRMLGPRPINLAFYAVFGNPCNAFNSLVQLEYERGIPRNPFINAGAIVVTDQLHDLTGDAVGAVLDFLRTR